MGEWPVERHIEPRQMLSKMYYPHCSVLAGSRNGFQNDFTSICCCGCLFHFRTYIQKCKL